VTLLVGAAAHDVPDAAVEAAIDGANAVLPDYAQVRRWARTPRPFSFDDDTLTANGRVRRSKILARANHLLEALYRTELAS
jgi:long-subunit acyl-CoA synthetase (AMP-forming)